MSVPKEKNILYIALTLTDESQEKLKNWFLNEKMPLIQKGHMYWNDYTVYCHHMTIVFHTEMTAKQYKWAVSHNEEKFKITVNQFGMSDKAIAVGVKTLCPSNNEIKHITLATNKSNNGKPVDSNYILNWKDIMPIELEGVVTIYEKVKQVEVPEIDHEDYKYIGLIFDTINLSVLKNIAHEYVRKLGWKSYYVTAHHITIANKEDATAKILKWADLHINQEVEFTITKIGWTNRVIALQVDSLFPSAYKIKHLTLAINMSHKDAQSGEARTISNWQDYDNMTLKGYVTYVR